jgi:hypothetical protein
MQTSSFSGTGFIANRTDSCTGHGWLFLQRLRVRKERKVREWCKDCINHLRTLRTLRTLRFSRTH